MVHVQYDEFVTEQAPGLLRLAFVLTGDPHRAEDLTQAALLDAHRHWRRVSCADRPDAYLRRILVNQHLAWHRRRSSTETPTPVDRLPSLVAADATDDVAARDELRSMLAALPPRARAVLVLRYFGDLDDAAIGDVLGIASSTVRATASRALATLRQRHSELEEER